MNPTTCRHRHQLKLASFLAEIPTATKTCDCCGYAIRLDWFWRTIYLLTCFISPTVAFLQATFRLRPIWLYLPLFGAAMITQYFLSWQIINRGKYILKTRKHKDRERS